MRKKSARRPRQRRPLTALSGSLNDLRAAKKEWSGRLLKRKSHQGVRAFTLPVTPDLDWNLMGVGVGEKIVDGQRTGVMALKFLVRAKYHDKHINKKHRLPKSIAGLPVDVEEVGLLRRFGAVPAPDAPNPRGRIRPAQPGCSIGFVDPAGQFDAGTFGALVKDSGGLYILSNSHVLADEGQLNPGAPISQPGSLDDGSPPTDEIAELTRFIKLQPGAPNKVDCAIAAVDSSKNVSNSILQIGPPQGVGDAKVDMTVHKFGRTTGYTVGHITSIDTDVSLQYETGIFTFAGQITIAGSNGQAFADAGDSGALILERGTNLAVGLLIGGSPSHGTASHLSDVLSALKVTLA
jgi:hypothetical protein